MGFPTDSSSRRRSCKAVAARLWGWTRHFPAESELRRPPENRDCASGPGQHRSCHDAIQHKPSGLVPDHEWDLRGKRGEVFQDRSAEGASVSVPHGNTTSRWNVCEGLGRKAFVC